MGRIRNAQCSWFWNLQEPTHFWYPIQCLTDRARRLQDSTISQLPSPFSMCNIHSYQSLSKAPWIVLCAGQLEGGFQSILLPCREISLGMGLEKGGRAVKQGRNSPAALLWPAKNKSFPCPTDPCLGQVGVYGGRQTDPTEDTDTVTAQLPRSTSQVVKGLGKSQYRQCNWKAISQL